MSFTSKLGALLAFATLGLTAQGCIVVGGGGGGSLGAYSTGCASSIDCAGALVCRSANTVTAGGGGGNFCTNSCTPGGSCPASPDGRQVLCVTAGGSSQCYQGCFADRTCSLGYTAVMDSAGTCFCTPN